MLKRVEQIDDALKDATIVALKRLGEACEIGGGHAVEGGGGGVDACERERVREDARVGASVDGDAINA